MKKVRIGQYEVTLEVKDLILDEGAEEDTRAFLTWLHTTLYDCMEYYEEQGLMGTSKDYYNKWKSMKTY